MTNEDDEAQVQELKAATEALAVHVQALAGALTRIAKLDESQASTAKRVSAIETVVPVRKEKIKRNVFAVTVTLVLLVVAWGVNSDHYAQVRSAKAARQARAVSVLLAQQNYKGCMARNAQLAASAAGTKQVIDLFVRLANAPASPQQIAAYQDFLEEIALDEQKADVQVTCTPPPASAQQ